MVLRAGFHGTVGQPSAQVIDGSLKFDGTSSHLKKTPISTGNRRTFTFSCWVKRSEIGSIYPALLSAGSASGDTGFFQITFESDEFSAYMRHSSGTNYYYTNARLRDISSWYHLVVAMDTTQSAEADRLKMYINGVEPTYRNTSVPSPDQTFLVNNTSLHQIGATKNNSGTTSLFLPGYLSNVYLIDGQALGPEYFGFTDGLTNTWRPKKFKGPTSPNDGTTWSSNLTVSGGTYVIQNPGYAFDNDSYDTYADAAGAGDAVYTFSPTSTIRANSSVRVSAYAASGQDSNHIKVTYNNGVEVTKTAADLGLGKPGDQRWFDLSSYINFPSDISSIEYKSIGGGGRLSAIEIDGILLIDGLNDPKGFGTNGFYLPMDGNSPIGQDKSSRGNDWTPWYFGGSNSIEKSTGALPILNTVSGGRVATVGVRTDATVAAGVGTCALALPLVGIATDVSNQIDSKSSQKTIISNGDPTGSIAISNFYGGSYYFDGTGDYLNTTSGYSDLNFKTGDFTIEAWCYASSSARAGLWQLSYTSGGLRPDDLQLSCHYQNTKFNFGSAGGSRINGKEYSTNRWHHVAEVRKDGVISTYINGVLDQSWTDTSNYWEGDTYVCVGGYWNTSYLWNGYIQDFRIYNGVAKYTENFIPASTNPDILPDTPSGVSGGSELAKITDGAIAFDGTGDYLSVADNDDFDLGTGDFTFEAFINPILSHTNYRYIFSHFDGSNGHWLRVDGDGPGRIQFGAGGTVYITSTTIAPLYKWTHVAVVRVGTTVTLYLDGKSEGTYTLSGDITSTGEFRIGRQGGSTTHYFGGFISNVRINKGTALYTSNFTPPTRALTNVTNTKLLCCQSNTSAAVAAVFPGTGQQYTLQVSGSDYNSTYSKDKMFDSNEVSAYLAGDSSNVNWTIPGGLAFSSKLRVRAQGSGATGTITFNWDGGSYDLTVLNAGAQYYDVTSNVTSPITSITWTTGASAVGPYVSAWEVDDSLLIDRGPIANGDTAATNFTPFNTDINTVRGQETGYATLNPLATQKNGTITLSDNNLRATVGATRTSAYASLPFVGKMYYEVTYVVDRAYVFGMAPSIDFNTTADTVGQRFIGESSGSYGVGDDGTVYNNGVSNYQGSSLTNTFGLNDCMGWAYDSDSGQFSVYKNGVLQGTFTASTSRTYYPAITLISSSAAAEVNFGQKPFKFPPPDGYGPVNAANGRPETVIARPDQYVGVTTYPGDGTSVVVSDYQFKPDFVWIKGYTDADRHGLYDTVRGPQKRLQSAHVNAEDTQNGVMSFDDRGFSVGNYSDSNGSGRAYSAWAWKAGGDKGTFNIDDVGYANASDVNMNAGALNSTIYDQSEVWSTNSTMSTASGAFDGTDVGSSGNAIYTNGGRVLTSSSITINNKLEIYTNRTHTGTTDGTKITINGTDYYDKPLASTGWSEVVIPRETLPLTSTGNITITDTQGNSGLWSVRVDGKRLVDSTATPVNNPSIAATGCSVGTKQGFSIIKYTGIGGTNDETILHGLSQSPDMVIVKNLTDDIDWAVAHSALPDNRELHLNTDELPVDVAFLGLYKSNFTSTTFAVNYSASNLNYVNASGKDYIAYVWHSVPGLQKFGSYLGNADSSGNGPFIELGFRPALIWIKRITSASNGWYVVDTERSPINLANDYLYLNSDSSASGFTNGAVDILSNGFKLRSNAQATNEASTYIYAAWAEAPSINLYGGASNAR